MPDFNQIQRQRLAAKNQAMPDGSFPIRNVADLKRAIQAYGRAKNKAAAKAWIKKRARELGALDLLPESWRTDTLAHYGIKGQTMLKDAGYSDKDAKAGYEWLRDRGVYLNVPTFAYYGSKKKRR